MSHTDASGQTAPSAATAPRAGVLSRAIGVVVAPGETFGHVARDPRPVGMLLLTAVVSAVATGLFFSSEAGRMAWLDAAISQQESFGQTVPDAQYAVLERFSELLIYIVPLYSLVLGPIVWLIVAGILKAAFAVVAGGEATFKQALDVVATSGVIVMLRTLFVLPINYLQESMRGVTNFSAFVPMLPEGSFVVRFLGMIDLFAVWWVAVLAIGLAVLYRRPARSIAITLYAFYGVIALGISLVLTWAGGS